MITFLIPITVISVHETNIEYFSYKIVNLALKTLPKNSYPTPEQKIQFKKAVTRPPIPLNCNIVSSGPIWKQR